jgi:hypothetical protein
MNLLDACFNASQVKFGCYLAYLIVYGINQRLYITFFYFYPFINNQKIYFKMLQYLIVTSWIITFQYLVKKKKVSPHRRFPDRNKLLLKEPPLYGLLSFSFLVQEHLPLEKWIVH